MALAAIIAQVELLELIEAFARPASTVTAHDSAVTNLGLELLSVDCCSSIVEALGCREAAATDRAVWSQHRRLNLKLPFRPWQRRRPPPLQQDGLRRAPIMDADGTTP